MAMLDGGYEVTVTGISDEEVAAVPERAHLSAYRLDVTQADSVAELVEKFEELDVLVNCAGIIYRDGSEYDIDTFQRVIDVNLTGTFLGMRVAVEPMTAAGGGSIINVSSIEGLRGAPAVHPYVASKWAVRGLAKSAALELAPLNIRVNSIHPGFIRTPMTAKLPEDLVTVPLGRPGESREVSTFVVFLASDDSSYATGSEFVMDGGLVTDVPHKQF
jgi:3alpha(or 20beta)-hydroxysteroid dehydrogenase